MLLTLLFGCSIGETIGCDFRVNDDDRCQERGGIQSNGFDAMCEGLGGEVVEGGCPREGSVGECDMGEEIVDVYYEPKTVEEAEVDCADDEGEFTAG